MKYGWIPDLPDKRDMMFKAPRRLLLKLPREVDLRPLMPPVYDQGSLGSCTANASGGAVQYCHIRQQKEDFIPSRLFLYYLTRKLEGTEKYDSGGFIRDSLKAVNKWGVCREDPTWPYVISKFTKEPSQDAYNEAEKNQSIEYNRIEQDLDQIKARLSMAFPVVFGFSVYESFESEKVMKDGILPMPGSDERMVGGHAVLAVGYNDKTKRFIIRNSYGPEFGLQGYFTMPYKYLEDSNLSSDFWTIEQME